MKRPVMSKVLVCCLSFALVSLSFVSYVHADEHHAAFIKNIFIAEAEKILQRENDALDTAINKAPRPDAPAISHPTYPVGPLPGPQGPQGKPGPAASIPTCSPFKLLETAVAGDVVRLVPDPTNQLGAKAAMRKIKKGPVFDWATRAGSNSDGDIGNSIATDCQGNVYVTGQFAGTVTFGNNITLVSNGGTNQDILVAKLNPTTGEWIWATRAGGTTASDDCNSIATDCQGNVYVTGQFAGTVTFGNNITHVSNGGTNQDILVAKLNPTTGEWIWATRAGSDGSGDTGKGIATDCQGNVYVIGQFAGTVTFGNNITLVSNGGTNQDILVAKLNPTTGEWIWATRAGGTTASDDCNGIATDCQGNVYVIGQFAGTVTFGNDITLTSSEVTPGGSFSVDIFVAKLNSTTGEWIWATRAGGSASDIGNRITTDCSGNVFVTGQFAGTITFGNNITHVSAGGTDIFVAKLNPTTGEWIWATRAGSGFGDAGRGIATDCQGNVYVTGQFSGTVTFGNSITLVNPDSTVTDIFVAKVDSTSGEWVWATRVGASNINNDVGRGIATDCQRNVYITGGFAATVTFGNKITLVSNTDSLDIFVAKMIDDERTLKTLGILQESGSAGSTKVASFAGTVVSDVFTSLVPAADYYIDSTLTFTSCCCKCSCCCDANFKFMGTACSPTSFLLRDCC